MTETLIFDTSPLCHFARADWLNVLKAVVGEREALIPDVVVSELRLLGTSDSRVLAVLDTPWIQHRELRNPDEIAAFADFSARLVRNDRNRGEAGVLALARTLPGIAVIDDGAGRKAARDHGVDCSPTLRLLCDAIRQGLLTVPLVSILADDLIINEYRLPFKPGDFEKWGRDNGLL